VLRLATDEPQASAGPAAYGPQERANA